MAGDWYYVSNGTRVGPVSGSEVENLIKKQIITADTLVWNESQTKWMSAADSELRVYFADNAVAADGGDEIPVPVPLAGGAEQYSPNQCSQCNRTFAEDDLITLEGLKVCAECKPLFLRRLQEGGLESVGYYRYGGFWIRGAALFLDGIFVAIVTVPISFLSSALGEALTSRGDGMMLVVVIQIFSFFLNQAISLTYNVWFLVKKNATPGKMVCGLKVINADGTEEISVGKAIGRHFAKMLSGIILYIGYLMAAFDSEKRALHDHMCNTRVIWK